MQLDDGTTQRTTAAQLMAHLKKWPDQLPNIIMPRKCNQTAPDEINRFSDGSQIHQQNQAFALAAAGAWIPATAESDQTLEHRTFTTNVADDGHGTTNANYTNTDAHDDHDNRRTRGTQPSMDVIKKCRISIWLQTRQRVEQAEYDKRKLHD